MQPGVRPIEDPDSNPHATACNLSDDSSWGGGRTRGTPTRTLKREHRRRGAERFPPLPHPAPVTSTAMMYNVGGGHYKGVATPVQLRVRRFFFPRVSFEVRRHRSFFVFGATLLPVDVDETFAILGEIDTIDTNPAAQKPSKASVKVQKRVRSMVERPRTAAGEGALCPPQEMAMKKNATATKKNASNLVHTVTN